MRKDNSERDCDTRLGVGAPGGDKPDNVEILSGVESPVFVSDMMVYYLLKYYQA